MQLHVVVLNVHKVGEFLVKLHVWEELCEHVEIATEGEANA